MTPEALTRLRERASMQTSGGVTLVRSPDLRALLDAYDEAVGALLLTRPFVVHGNCRCDTCLASDKGFKAADAADAAIAKAEGR